LVKYNGNIRIQIMFYDHSLFEFMVMDSLESPVFTSSMNFGFYPTGNSLLVAEGNFIYSFHNVALCGNQIQL